MDERCDSTASWPEPEAEAMAYGRETRIMGAGGIRHWPKMALRPERGCRAHSGARSDKFPRSRFMTIPGVRKTSLRTHEGHANANGSS